MSNPYFNTTFLQFFETLFLRLWFFLTGQLPLKTALASDELQMLVLACVAVSSSLVGTFLILRRMSMLANSLSHTILIGIVVVFYFGDSGWHTEGGRHMGRINIEAMLAAALGMGVITTFLTQFLHRVVRLQQDASVGLVFSSLFAVGIILATLLTRNTHIGTEVVMGNVDALHMDDLRLVLIVLAINLVLIALFFKEYMLTTFDPSLAKALGFSVLFFDYLLMIQVSGTVIGAFRAVGVLMVLAFLTGPALTARLLVHDLKNMLMLSCGLGVAASCVGVALSRHLLTTQGIAFSTGGIVVCVLLVLFAIVVFVAKGVQNLKIKLLSSPHD